MTPTTPPSKATPTTRAHEPSMNRAASTTRRRGAYAQGALFRPDLVTRMGACYSESSDRLPRARGAAR